MLKATAHPARARGTGGVAAPAGRRRGHSRVPGHARDRYPRRVDTVRNEPEADRTAAEEPGGTLTVTAVRPTLRPALVVVACVAAVVVGGFAVAIAGSGEKSVGGASLGRLRGVGFAARPAGPIVRRIAEGGEPPADVVAALVVPSGAVVTSATRPRLAVSLYSGTFTIAVDHPAPAVSTFFVDELRHDHWSVLASDATVTGSGTRIFAKIPSSDGFYWEVGIVVRPAAVSITPALSGGGANGPTSTASVTVFEVDDAD